MRTGNYTRPAAVFTVDMVFKQNTPLLATLVPERLFPLPLCGRRIFFGFVVFTLLLDDEARYIFALVHNNNYYHYRYKGDIMCLSGEAILPSSANERNSFAWRQKTNRKNIKIKQNEKRCETKHKRGKCA